MYQYVAYLSFVSFKGNNLDRDRPLIIYINDTHVIHLKDCMAVVEMGRMHR